VWVHVDGWHTNPPVKRKGKKRGQVSLSKPNSIQHSPIVSWPVKPKLVPLTTTTVLPAVLPEAGLKSVTAGGLHMRYIEAVTDG